MRTRKWTVDIYLDEHDDAAVRAEARLHTNDNTHVIGVGTAQHNPDDLNVPEINDEIAAARALESLSRELLHLATEDIEGIHDRAAQLPR